MSDKLLPLKRLPMLTIIIIIVMFVIRAMYDKSKCNEAKHVGIDHLFNIVFGADTWKCSDNFLHSTFLWFPLFYIEAVKGHMYTAGLILQCVLATFATIAMSPIVNGGLIQTTNCCSSYTYYFILGAFFAQIPFEILKHGFTTTSLISYLLVTLMVSLTHIHLSSHVIKDPIGGQLVGSAVLTIYIMFLTFLIIVLRLYNKEPNKMIFSILYALIFITIFIYTMYQERDDKSINKVNILHHAAPFLFAGLYVLLLELYMARKILSRKLS